MATEDIQLGKFSIASTDRLRFTLSKDGAAWTGVDSVSLTFRRPDGTEIIRAATLESGAVWYYDTLTTDLLVPGSWLLGVTVTDGALVKTFPHAISLAVFDRP